MNGIGHTPKAEPLSNIIHLLENFISQYNWGTNKCSNITRRTQEGDVWQINQMNRYRSSTDM